MKKIFLFLLLISITPLFADQFNGIFELNYFDSREVCLNKMSQREWNLLNVKSDTNKYIFYKTSGTYAGIPVKFINLYFEEDKLTSIEIVLLTPTQTEFLNFINVSDRLLLKYDFYYDNDADSGDSMVCHYLDSYNKTLLSIVVNKDTLNGYHTLTFYELESFQRYCDNLYKDFENDL